MSSVHPYPALARLAVERHLAGEKCGKEMWLQLSNNPELWSPRRGCFVTIKSDDGYLRGCIGTIAPTQAGLGEEITANAISSATRDPRFEPLSTEELKEIHFSVDILEPPESVASLDDLDPFRWGVIVSKGMQRGLLLPDLEGVDTVIKQVSIAASKAGLQNLEGISLERFAVNRYPEKRNGR